MLGSAGKRSLLKLAVAASSAMVAILGIADRAYAQIVVQQVEASTGNSYAPVNFNGSSTATYGTITLRAQGPTASDTFSVHAATVANRFYGNLPASGVISDAYIQTTSNFVNALNTQGSLSPGQTLPSLNFSTNSIRISNNSWVASFGNATADENAIRRLDYVVDRDNVVLVAGAAEDGTIVGQNLIWTSRNALSVAGTLGAGFSPPASGVGKRRADLWSTEEPSYATGRVSGFAAGLISQAGATNASRNQVVRSLLMTGADKSTSGGLVAPWTRDTANNLDTTSGAGQADYNKSLAILNGGQRTPQTVTAGNTANVATTALLGWSYANIGSGQQAIVFTVPQGIQSLTATLNWNVSQNAAGTINTSDAGRIFANLALDVRPATFNGSQYVLGSALSGTGLSSNATLDNVEHLYFDGTSGIVPGGTYAFVITGDGTSTNYGFSYNITAAPEPGVVGVAGIAIAGMLLRRRRAK